MKIVYCIHGTYNSGGMERVLSNKANYLADVLNYEVYITTTGQRGRPHFYQFSNKIKCIDLDINYSETTKGNSLLRLAKSVFKNVKHKYRLKKILFEVKPDITISMFTIDADFLYKIKDGSKKIAEIHFNREFRLFESRKGIMGIFDRYMTAKNDRIASKYNRFVVLTNQDKQSWKYQNNISVIYNAVTKQTDFVSATLENKNVLAIGRLTYQKNLEILVDIWVEITKKHPDWNLTIVGTGETIALQDLISQKELNNTITLVPSTNTIQEYYKNSSVYVMTSRYEGLPMVLLEAQSYGLPIVSFDCKCGPREIINNDDNGYLIALEDKEDFIEKVCLLIENYNLRKEFGKKALLNSKKFSEEIIMNQWVELFEELTK